MALTKIQLSDLSTNLANTISSGGGGGRGFTVASNTLYSSVTQAQPGPNGFRIVLHQGGVYLGNGSSNSTVSIHNRAATFSGTW